MPVACPRATTTAILLGLALSLRPATAPAQSQAIDDYVLVAKDGINANRLTVTGGDIAVLDGSFASTRALVAPSSTITAPSARLDSAATCAALHTASSRGGGSGCGAAPLSLRRPFPSLSAACGFPTPFPPCDPLHAPVIVPRGATIALPPGIYGDVRVEGGAGGAGTLRLAGEYGICNLRVSRAGAVQFTGATTLLVGGSLTASNGTRLAPASGVSPAAVNVYVAGTLVRLTRKSSMAARLCAPNASLRLGSRAGLEGRFVAADMRFRRNIVTRASGDDSTTTTTTTLPPSAACGDGVVAGDEVCDGDVACTSPGGSFLFCSACAAFTSGPCTTTTTTLPPDPGTPVCGNRIVEAGETCDDGNTTPCDGCSAICGLEQVGNRVLDCDEECDDGNTLDCDGCDGGGEIECGNGTIDGECGEVCDGTNVGGQTCAGSGTIACAADCRRIDRAACPDPGPQEVCGNCVDDDLNGLVDFEDPACCAATSHGTLAKARVTLRRKGGTLLALRGRLGGAPLTAAPATDQVVLQVRTPRGAELLCARLPAGALKAKGKTSFRFRDWKHRVAGAQSLDVVRLTHSRRGLWRAKVLGRRLALDMPAPGPLQVTLGFVDPTAVPAGGRCAMMTAPLRSTRAGGLRAP